MVWCAPACLGAALVVQLALAWHLRGSEISPYPDLSAPFASLPLAMDGPTRRWHGQDTDGLEAFRLKLPYSADDILSRWYAPAPSGTPLSLYMVYSRTGDDRKHHPEICIRDASGASEDLEARRRIALDAEGQRQVMRFRFRTRASQYTTVYYWHYSLTAAPGEGQSFLRALHQKQSHPLPSLTVQVSLLAEPEELDVVEGEFLTAVDAALQKSCLPATARMGCDRLPIALVRE